MKGRAILVDLISRSFDGMFLGRWLGSCRPPWNKSSESRLVGHVAAGVPCVGYGGDGGLAQGDFFTVGVHRLRRRLCGGRKWNCCRNMQVRPCKHRVKKPSDSWGTRLRQSPS